ncbi:hypothetical protein [Streptomyces sp. 1222.5]|uniref:hypothetical protein n=1 Tax=Streptomyces sp. 1222.5 TaxID=1881026 RepID=UPI003D72EFAB
MKRLVIDCRDVLDRAMLGMPGGLRPVLRWLRLHGIDPADVPVDSEVVIEPTAFGPVIRYTAYLRNDEGFKYADPEDPDFAASEDRTALLCIEPDPEWLSTRREADGS